MHPATTDRLMVSTHDSIRKAPNMYVSVVCAVKLYLS